jgi:hypothetical protein
MMIENLVSWTVEYRERAWTTNAERSGNKWERAKLTKKWRTDFATLGRFHKAPKYEWVEIYVDLELKGPLQDTGSCFPSVKAAVDGLVDIGVLIDDSPKYVHRLSFSAPKRSKENVIRLTLVGPLR